MKCQQLHETIVRDILDVMDSAKDFDEIEWLRQRNNVGSIARRANNLILVFPVICSTSLNINTAAIISKAIERKCVSLLQILFSSIQLTSADNMYDYLRQFHRNLDLSPTLTLDTFMDTMDHLVDEGAITVTDREIYEAVKEDMKNINYYLSTDLNPISIKDYYVKKSAYGESYVEIDPTIVTEAKRNSHKRTNTQYNGPRGGNNNNNGGNNTPPPPRFTVTRSSSDGFADRLSKAISNKVNGIIDDRNKKIADSNKELKTQVDYFKNQLNTGEIAKANELMPTTMIVNFTTKDDKHDYHTTTGVIGVKAKLYPVDSMDIINRIADKHAESNTIFNLIRAATREISFFKDFLFAVDKAKLDAIQMSKESNNARLFKVLERRANMNRLTSLLKKNDMSPITSLLISQEEVEYLKKYHNVDMDKSYVTRGILERYNLMDIVIADESLELARFLFDDGDGIYETLPFDSLEKEAKDSSYKKVVNLMSKLNR